MVTTKCEDCTFNRRGFCETHDVPVERMKECDFGAPKIRSMRRKKKFGDRRNFKSEYGNKMGKAESWKARQRRKSVEVAL